MANTTTVKNRIVQITGLDVDWHWNVELPDFSGLDAISVRRISFRPSAANDVMIIHDGTIDGVSVFEVKCAADTDDRIKYFNPPERMAPVIDISDCTLGVAADAKVIIEIA